MTRRTHRTPFDAAPFGHVRPAGRTSEVDALVACLATRERLAIVVGALGTGRFTVAACALRGDAAASTGRDLIVVDGSEVATLDDLVDALVAHSGLLVQGAAHSVEARMAAVDDAGQWIVITDLDGLDTGAWETLASWYQGAQRARLVVTCLRPPPLAADRATVVRLAPFSSTHEVARDLAFRIFLDAVPDEALRRTLARTDAAVRHEVVAACGGLPLLLRLAGARTRFLHPTEVVELLTRSEERGQLHALNSLFGSAYAESLQRTLQRLPVAARALLRLCEHLGPLFTVDDVWQVLESLSTELATARTPATVVSQRTTNALLSDTVPLLETLSMAGFLDHEHHTHGTLFRLPGHVRAAIRFPALERADDEERWNEEIRAASLRSLVRGAGEILARSDRYEDAVARERARRLRARLTHVVTHPDASADVLRPVDRLLAAGALAWFWRRTGIDRRHWGACFGQTLDDSAPDRFDAHAAVGAEADRVAQALTEVHLLARQAGDVAARDALASRMKMLHTMLTHRYDRHVASARSRFAYVLGAAAFTAGDRAGSGQFGRSALDDARAAGRHDLYSRHSSVLAFHEFEEGLHEQSIRRMEEAVSVLSHMNAVQDAAVATTNLAALAYQHGAIDLATETYRRALTNEIVSWDRVLRCRVQMGLARCLDVLQLPGAGELHADTVALASTIGDEAQRADAMIRQSWHMLLRERRTAEAIEQMRLALELERAVGRERLRTHTMHAHALATAAAGDLDTAYLEAVRTVQQIHPSRAQHFAEVMALEAALTPDLDAGLRRMADARAIADTLQSGVTHTLFAVEELYLLARTCREQTSPDTPFDPDAEPPCLDERMEEVEQKLRWIMEPTAPPFGSIRTPRPRWQRSVTLAATLRRLRPLLPTTLICRLEGELYWAREDLLLCSDRVSVRRPDGTWLDLSSTPVLARLLYAIARETTNAGFCTLDVCLEAGWPDERIQHEAALNRIYQAISRLRRMNLRDVVEAHEGGYRIAPSVRVVLAPEF